MLVTAEGRGDQIALQRSLDPSLDARSIEAVRQWRFQPATDPSSKPVPAWVTVEVNFKVM